MSGAWPRALSGREHLLGDRFTVGDLNVAAIFAWGKMARLDLGAFPGVKRWLDSSFARPAYRKVTGRP